MQKWLSNGPTAQSFPAVGGIRPLKNERGEITGAINCFYDITERKEAEQRQYLLMNELAHRSKNLLAVIASIASRSLSGTRSLTEAREVLTHRIQALARSQSALLRGGFEGAPIAEIIRLLEFEAFSDQVKSAGPDVLLNARVAQTFALVVHELATNATKRMARCPCRTARSRFVGRSRALVLRRGSSSNGRNAMDRPSSLQPARALVTW